MTSERSSDVRKPFHLRALRVYGDLATVTQTVSMMGHRDGGMMGNAKGTRV